MKRTFLSSSCLVVLLSVIALLATACPQKPDWDADQQAVHDAMKDWAAAVTRSDPEAMWDMLSPDAQDYYKRELEAPKGVRQTVKLSQVALEPDSRMPEEEKERTRKLLKTLPEHPEKMTPKDYYVWRIKPDLTPEGAQRTDGLFAKANIGEISIDGERATVLLKHGDPDRYSWVRHDGVWKFDLKPSILRALEDARKREAKSK